MSVMGIFRPMLLCYLLLPNTAAYQCKEYRIPMPFTLAQTEIGHHWSTAEYSLLNTGGGEGVQIIENVWEEDRPYAQFTHKILHMSMKIPRWIKAHVPSGFLELDERSTNRFPEVVTVITNPDYMQDRFFIRITSKYMENDDCTQDNIFQPSDIKYTDKFNARKVVNIDIVNDGVMAKEYHEESDPKKCRSEKLNLGPLTSDWKSTERRSCIYKLVETDFQWFGLQKSTEAIIHEELRSLFQLFHRHMFCWADKWAGMTMDEILAFEEDMKIQMDKARKKEKIRGFSAKF